MAFYGYTAALKHPAQQREGRQLPLIVQLQPHPQQDEPSKLDECRCYTISGLSLAIEYVGELARLSGRSCIGSELRKLEQKWEDDLKQVVACCGCLEEDFTPETKRSE